METDLVCVFSDCAIYATHGRFVIFAAEDLADVANLKVKSLGGKEGIPIADLDHTWTASRCPKCQRVAVWKGQDLIWPRVSAVGPAPAGGMPEDVQDLYEEGRQVAAISRRAGAALLRAALERLFEHIDSGGGSLNDKIGRLQAKVPAGLGQALDVLRTAGNGVLHEAIPSGVAALVIQEGSDQSSIFDYLCGVINRLVEESITGPARDNELFEQLPQQLKDQIARRDAR